MLQLVKYFYVTLALIITVFIVIKSFDYLTPDFSSGFLADKKMVFDYYQPFLLMHIIGAPIAFLAGLFQISFKKKSVHKYAGRVYLVAVMFLAAPAGFVMAFYAIGGLWSTANFLLLSTLWIYFSFAAYKFIGKGNINKHRRFMIRSFILANSAIFIRIFSYFNNHFEVMDVVAGYIIISWISWLPWLIIYELKLLFPLLRPTII